MTRHISRDPFARTTVYAERDYQATDGCQWCGSVRRTLDGARYLYLYETRTDGGRAFEVPGRFCSVDCMRTYHA